MFRRIAQAITSVGLLALAGSLQALSIPINTFATGENAGSATVATLSLNQNGSNVDFRLTNSVGNLGSAANAGTFISDLGFSYSGSGPLTSASFTGFGGSGQTISAGDFAINPPGNFQGGYNFSLELGFPTSNSGGGAQRFLDGDFVTWTISNVLLDDFLGPVSGTGGLTLAAVHIQSLASGNSTTYISAVPLPAAAWLFLSALGGLVGVKKLRSRSSAAPA